MDFQWRRWLLPGTMPASFDGDGHNEDEGGEMARGDGSDEDGMATGLDWGCGSGAIKERQI